MTEEYEIIVITGSSNKFGDEIDRLAGDMRIEGKFVINDKPFHALPEHISRREFMRCILYASKLLVYNKEGYIGYHTDLEIRMAKCAGVKVEYLFPIGEGSS